ncbi:hypothetical protein P3T73_01075 [Kiritimatiellota bacterium B12222]|nr:hypothetical protein P3T73_01075 [Kiritimatiellota bacterium B12222]
MNTKKIIWFVIFLSLLTVIFCFSRAVVNKLNAERVYALGRDFVQFYEANNRYPESVIEFCKWSNDNLETDWDLKSKNKYFSFLLMSNSKLPSESNFIIFTEEWAKIFEDDVNFFVRNQIDAFNYHLEIKGK